MYQLIVLNSRDYLQNTLINTRHDLPRQTAEMKCDTEQIMKLEWLYKIGPECKLN